MLDFDHIKMETFKGAPCSNSEYEDDIIQDNMRYDVVMLYTGDCAAANVWNHLYFSFDKKMKKIVNVLFDETGKHLVIYRIEHMSEKLFKLFLYEYFEKAPQ